MVVCRSVIVNCESSSEVGALLRVETWRSGWLDVVLFRQRAGGGSGRPGHRLARRPLAVKVTQTFGTRRHFSSETKWVADKYGSAPVYRVDLLWAAIKAHISLHLLTVSNQIHKPWNIWKGECLRSGQPPTCTSTCLSIFPPFLRYKIGKQHRKELKSLRQKSRVSIFSSSPPLIFLKNIGPFWIWCLKYFTYTRYCSKMLLIRLLK